MGLGTFSTWRSGRTLSSGSYFSFPGTMEAGPCGALRSEEDISPFSPDGSASNMELGGREGTFVPGVSVVPSATTIGSLQELESARTTWPSHRLGLHGSLSRAKGGEEAICSDHSRHVNQASGGMGSTGDRWPTCPRSPKVGRRLWEG